MKKWWPVLALVCFLSGCTRSEMTMETVADEYIQSAAALQREVMVTLPSEAAILTMENALQEKIYMCNDYTITMMILESGDMEQSLQTVCGYGRDDLTILETQPGDFTRYDFVWSSAGEGGDQVGKAAILDDGSYHYVLTCMAEESVAGTLSEDWNRIFDSLWLG